MFYDDDSIFVVTRYWPEQSTGLQKVVNCCVPHLGCQTVLQSQALMHFRFHVVSLLHRLFAFVLAILLPLMSTVIACFRFLFLCSVCFSIH